MRLAALLCVLGLASACADGGGGLPIPARPSTVPSPAPPAPPPPGVNRLISVGEEVKDTLTFHGDQRVYELTAPSNGTLVARVGWEPSRDPLYLSLADRIFQSNEGSIVAMLRWPVSSIAWRSAMLRRGTTTTFCWGSY